MHRVGNTVFTTSLNLAVRYCNHGYQIILIAKRIDSRGNETIIELPSPHIAATAAEARMIVADTLAPFVERLMVGERSTHESVH
ncbi:hypothetical protein BI312_23640 (plasmid) [Xanthomonas citri pv. citri]|nr:hypothetical protein BJD10_23445 [Xanthomonas hortorum pv. gardneri]APR13276.1 hypothetical protein BI314_23850 [Xanthomonas citri pv. citri]APR17883.1 hypothetical protein BI315_23640 [Xanthomonas citri pv. citri]APR22608.1 hypothetical protein BI316_23810 [Xanthomonas citri pv. citri]APR27245.1 hypothetical protein BJD09_23675 [Xanthomonas citri pv. citri]